MKLTTTEAKKRHFFEYFEYFEAQAYYKCLTCSTIVEPKMGYCPECVKELDPDNRQQLFCYECREPIIHRRDYFRNEKHFGNDQNFARQVFREIEQQRWEQETVDLSNFTYNPSRIIP